MITTTDIFGPPQTWANDARCTRTDPEAFFPDKGSSPRAGKAVCKRCPVATECLNYALTNGERFGVWGGLTEDERRLLLGKKGRHGA